ncbi:hypothetical protein Purlil1_1557 [Purpureocillium lilacinum]|uniref:Uncharacterized protein n=1 Tax=Purpureocillium lilacinum TaxID=33203 RepID=A0ABR0CDT3_PURLI|nr:hypothetical protein Purlil1_1557 [Purpureocillium lilacinum]
MRPRGLGASRLSPRSGVPQPRPATLTRRFGGASTTVVVCPATRTFAVSTTPHDEGGPGLVHYAGSDVEGAGGVGCGSLKASRHQHHPWAVGGRMARGNVGRPPASARLTRNVRHGGLINA